NTKSGSITALTLPSRSAPFKGCRWCGSISDRGDLGSSAHSPDAGCCLHPPRTPCRRAPTGEKLRVAVVVALSATAGSKPRLLQQRQTAEPQNARRLRCALAHALAHAPALAPTRRCALDTRGTGIKSWIRFRICPHTTPNPIPDRRSTHSG